MDLTIGWFRLRYPGHLIRVRLWQHPGASNTILRMRVDHILHNKSFLILYWLLLEWRTLLPGLKWFCFGFPVPLSSPAGSVFSNFWLMLLWNNCQEWYYFVWDFHLEVLHHLGVFRILEHYNFPGFKYLLSESPSLAAGIKWFAHQYKAHHPFCGGGDFLRWFCLLIYIPKP